MAFKKYYCPQCGSETQIDDNRDFSFCIECGYKIVVNKKESGFRDESLKNVSHSADVQTKENESKDAELDNKLKEVQFYYDLSNEKEEYLYINDEPVYYIKGQDLLFELSQQYSRDFRIWWKMSLPVDFIAVLGGKGFLESAEINNMYFQKALDFAPIEEKRNIVGLQDSYNEKKRQLIGLRNIREEEENKKKRELELEKQRAEEEERRKQMEEAQRAREEELFKAQRDKEIDEDISKQLRGVLATGKYGAVDGKYFQYEVAGNSVFIVLKCIDGVLNILSYYQSKGDTTTRHSDKIPVLIDNNGVLLKNTPQKSQVVIRMNGTFQPLVISYLKYKKNVVINGMELKDNPALVKQLIEIKKPAITLVTTQRFLR